ncbi:hypothetical protein JXR01_03245 [Candidatus Kaiserbacteria bacterium]|nr:MAG: hypothetical protein JXR01_03245 [Candidatus Kaiserbacteria bacterium]
MESGIEQDKKVEKIVVPDEIFNAWLDSNITHPQEWVGIVAKTGEAFFKSDLSFEDLGRAELTEEQIEKAMRRMNSAHGAKEIVPSELGTDRAKRVAMVGLWEGIKYRIFMISTGYISHRLYHQGLNSIDIMSREKYVSTCAAFLQENFEKNPEIRDQAANFFRIWQKGLELEEIRDLEKERRDGFDYTNVDSSEQYSNKLNSFALADIVRDLLFKYIAKDKSIGVPEEEMMDLFEAVERQF